MRPLWVAWCAAHGIPGWLVPDYVSLAGLSAMLGGLFSLEQARRDGAAVKTEAHALALAYVAALLCGYALESLRMLPTALAQHSPTPLLQVGRAAYGGLLGAMLVSGLYLRFRRVPLGPFFDRASVAFGISFFFVRIGCFLAGCDFGIPTQSLLGVRFQPGSPAAMLHVRSGLVPPGSASLPVHPTELYEAALGLLIAGLAWRWLRRPRDGMTFLRCLAVYAGGRYLIEWLRGDADRGIYLGLSFAQYLSIFVLIGTGLLWARPVRLARLRPQGPLA